jgi:hypothetical protein
MDMPLLWMMQSPYSFAIRADLRDGTASVRNQHPKYSTLFITSPKLTRLIRMFVLSW